MSPAPSLFIKDLPHSEGVSDREGFTICLKWTQNHTVSYSMESVHERKGREWKWADYPVSSQSF